MSAKRPDVMEAFNASWRIGVSSELSGTLDVGGGLSPTPTPLPAPFDGFALRGPVKLFSEGDESPGCGFMFKVGDIVW